MIQAGGGSIAVGADGTAAGAGDVEVACVVLSGSEMPLLRNRARRGKERKGEERKGEKGVGEKRETYSSAAEFPTTFLPHSAVRVPAARRSSGHA